MGPALTSCRNSKLEHSSVVATNANHESEKATPCPRFSHDCAEAVALADRILMLEHGTIAMELRVPLPRPRDRGDRQFAAFEGQVLHRILGRDEQLPTNESNQPRILRSAR
jgi:hypothetical protein